MKRTIQLILFLFLILIMFVFFNTYFSEDKNSKVEKNPKEKQIDLDKEMKSKDASNIIKNLKYNVTFDDNKEYIINSNLSEVNYENGVEMITMSNVTAIFLDESIFPVTVTANKALYNNSTYDTYFSENVQINYMDNIILSNKMDLNFKENIIIIYENVEYEGDQGTIKSDNIKINLITKKIQIYMNDEENKVEILRR